MKMNVLYEDIITTIITMSIIAMKNTAVSTRMIAIAAVIITMMNTITSTMMNIIIIITIITQTMFLQVGEEKR